jgi:hypothetical protein
LLISFLEALFQTGASPPGATKERTVKASGERLTFTHHRIVGGHHETYRVDILGLTYSIRRKGRLVCRGSTGMLSEDEDVTEAVKSFAINDITNLMPTRH